MSITNNFLFSRNNWIISNNTQEEHICNMKKLNLNSSILDILNCPIVCYNKDSNTILYHPGMIVNYKKIDLTNSIELVYNNLIKEKTENWFNTNICKILPILNNIEYKEWCIDNNII